MLSIEHIRLAELPRLIQLNDIYTHEIDFFPLSLESRAVAAESKPILLI